MDQPDLVMTLYTLMILLLVIVGPTVAIITIIGYLVNKTKRTIQEIIK